MDGNIKWLTPSARHSPSRLKRSRVRLEGPTPRIRSWRFVRMKWHSTLMCLAACIFFSLSLLAQEWKPGLVVESVATSLEAEKAGLKEGDVLLRWSRGDDKGEMESPFDVSLTELEQAQRGTVT